MDKRGSIIVIEQNIENRRLFGQIFLELSISNKVLYFDTLQEAEEKLLLSNTKPFIFFANILQFQEQSTNHKYVGPKSQFPCFFYSLLFHSCFIIDTYSVPTQSYFINPYSEEKFKDVLSSIIQFWNKKKDEKTKEVKKESKDRNKTSINPSNF